MSAVKPIGRLFPVAGIISCLTGMAEATTDNETHHARFPDGTTSHSTRLPKNGNLVAGYLLNPLDETTSHSTKGDGNS